MPQRQTLSCIGYALLAVCAVLLWQTTTVYCNYQGNWTALFMTGDHRQVPPELASQTYLFHGSPGYDGQFYRYVAHDPWARPDWRQYYDNGRLRHYRILVPALAWLLAAGRDQFVEPVYIGLILGWIFLGVYWLGRYAQAQGYRPAWGLGFLLLPATLTSIDRMTVDVALAALCVALVLYSREKSVPKIYVVLLLAPLVRETGALLIAAVCGYELTRKCWRRAAVFATAILPAAVWYAYIVSHIATLAVRHTGGKRHWLPVWIFQSPGIGIFIRLFRPVHYHFNAWLTWMAQIADVLALCGFLALVAIGIWILRRRPWTLEQWVILLFLAAILATSSSGFWNNVYGYGRPYTPLIFLVTSVALSRGIRWALVPSLLLAARIGMQIAPQMDGVLKRWL
jgi:hypothetical protein